MIHENMTVGWLKKFIEENNIPDDSEILVERVEDVYFEKHGWDKTSIFKENDMYCEMKEYKETCYNMQEENITDEELESFKTQYHPIWCPVKYKDDNNLYLDLHY